MKRRTLLIVCLAVVLILGIFALILRSKIDYDVMSATEKLKAQIMEERRTRSREIFAHIEVIRPWYSLSPTDWTFAVTFASEPEVVYYELVNGRFAVREG